MTAVISGVGALASLGVGLPAFLDGLAAGAGRVGPIAAFDARTFPVKVAAEVPLPVLDDLTLAHQLDRRVSLERIKDWRRQGVLRDRKVLLALLCAAEAWRAAGCGPGDEAAGLSLAVGLEQLFPEDILLLTRGGRFDWSRDAHTNLPEVRYRSTPDLAPQAVRELLGLTGPSTIHLSACASGTLAIAHAAALIERGTADIVLAGGTDSMVNPMGIGGMGLLGATSPRNEADACRPFDRRRDGLVIGEGAAMFVVEHQARARRRGVRPLATILGWGATQDAYRPTAPRPDGTAAARAMVRALERAGLPPSAVGYVNAHGTGTQLNDPAECKAIRLALGKHAEQVPCRPSRAPSAT